ncbi:MAG: FAD-binding oxidoreductase, partial [Acetobacteraceae bacterium]
MERRRKVFGWGSIGDGLTGEEESAALERFSRLFGTSEFERRPVPDVAALELPPPRLAPPASLQAICSDARYERALHCFGKSYSDAVQGLLGEYDGAPDIVIFPHNESEIAAALDWAASQGATVTPFGGGSSVVGGVGSGRRTAAPVVTLDLRRFDRVLEVDRVSRSARIAAGVFGPALESQLKPHGLTLRHFPQSFEHSTLGGWIATRSAGHYASLRTHIDDFVEGVRVVSPRGAIAMRRFPASGAGPSPERLFIGSEGILGVITEAWVRLSVRPTFRAGRAA